MGISIEIADKILKKILNDTDFDHPTGLRVSLHTADPGETGANEVEEGAYDYARKEPTLGGVADKACSNSAALEWVNLPAVTIKFVGLWDTEATPNFWWSGAMAEDKAVGAGDTFKIDVGDLDFELDV